jgi:hypothetical protein
VFVRQKPAGRYKYLQVVESFREDGKVKQKVVCTLGRLDRLQAEGNIDGLVKSLSRFAPAPSARHSGSPGYKPITASAPASSSAARPAGRSLSAHEGPASAASSWKRRVSSQPPMRPVSPEYPLLATGGRSFTSHSLHAAHSPSLRPHTDQRSDPRRRSHDSHESSMVSVRKRGTRWNVRKFASCCACAPPRPSS